jgi:hypothetical protein
VKKTADTQKKRPVFRRDLPSLSLQLELATLIGVLALTARILLLLAGLLAAALLLLAGLLTGVLGLLTRVLILSAHSAISLARGSLGQPSNLPLVAKEHCSRVIIPWHRSGAHMATGTGHETCPVQGQLAAAHAVAALGSRC